MKHQHSFVAVITAVSLMGCASEPPLPPVSRSAPNADMQAVLVRAVLDGLKDPDSAKFGQITVIDVARVPALRSMPKMHPVDMTVTSRLSCQTLV
jgi:hypothetical protein